MWRSLEGLERRKKKKWAGGMHEESIDGICWIGLGAGSIGRGGEGGDSMRSPDVRSGAFVSARRKKAKGQDQ